MKKFFFAIFSISFGWLALVAPALALDFTPPPFKDSSYEARYVSQSIADPISIVAGETKEITVRFKNIGKANWPTIGNYASIYTFEPSYRASVFADKSWLSANQPAKVAAATASGKTGEFTFTLKAPATPGNYKEQFYLAAENRTWIKGGYFYLKIKVTAPQTKTDATAMDSSDSSDFSGNSALGEDTQDATDFKSHLLALSARSLAVGEGGQILSFKVVYVNDGLGDWHNFSWQEAGSFYAGTNSFSGRVSIADSIWQSAKVIIARDQITRPGEHLPLDFTFRAPATAGDYVARFKISADSHTLDGGILEVPIKVLSDAPVGYEAPTFPSERVLLSEPNIRVGLYKDSAPVHFVSPFIYQIFDGPNYFNDLGENNVAILSYNKGKYHFEGGGFSFDSVNPLRLVPVNPASAYFELVNYTRSVSYKGKINFNAYRGILEYVYSPKSDLPYVINELPLDQYIAGIAETGNEGALEYIKAILVAARSYAYFHLNANEESLFDVYATTVDQLYLGYNSEINMPRVAQAAAVTMGEMITYNAAPVVTPYFAHSNGKTKTWKQVWGGQDKPWLQSVECIYDKGKNQYGHGVGMSAADASARASKDNWTYDQILGHYYTGTMVEKIY